MKDGCLLVQTALVRNADQLAQELSRLHKHADLFELRADAWTESPQALLDGIKSCPLPWIATVRRAEEGGQWTGTESQRMELLQLLAEHADLVDLEARCGAVPFAPERTIVSWHDFEGSPDDPEAILLQMTKSMPGAWAYKLATTPTLATQLGRLMKLPLTQAGDRIAVMAMGPLGPLSRSVAARCGSRLIYAHRADSTSSAPGQRSLEHLCSIDRVHRQSPGTRALAVVGSPLGHSLSPQVHNAALAHEQLDIVYVALEASKLAEAVEAAADLGIDGLSVTLPFKTEAAALASRWHPQHESLASIGAANTLLRHGSEWWAANTDASGFLAALKAGAPQLDMDGSRALVLGAGGSARTVAACLKQAGMQVTVVSRSAERRRPLIESLGVEGGDWQKMPVEDAALIVNTTPVGMAPKVEHSPLDDGRLAAGQVIFDLIYRPIETRLLRQATQVGARSISGMEMFLHQAAEQFQLFTGRAAPLEVMRAAVQLYR